MTNYSDRLVSFIWDVADLLRGPYRPPEYRKVMLHMTVLRRLDCVLEPSKSKVLEEHKKLKGQNPAYIHKMLQRAARQQFYNTSKYDFERLKADSEAWPKISCTISTAFPGSPRPIRQFRLRPANPEAR